MKRQLSHLMLGVLCGAAITTPTMASSHREAPGITKYPQVDGTDFYMFTSYEAGRNNYVTFLANYVPVHAPYGGPNYFPLDPRAIYEIHVDNNGDAVEDLTFSFNPFDSFDIADITVGGIMQKSILRNIGKIAAGDPPQTLAHAQSFNLDLITGPRRTGTRAAVTQAVGGSADFGIPFDYSGSKTFDIDEDGTPFTAGNSAGPSEYKQYADSFITEIDIPNCAATGGDGRVFVGQRYEAFKLALGEIFDLVNFVPVEGDSAPGAGDGMGFPGGITQDPNRNALIRNNVTTFALEVHKDCLGATDANPIIGAWTTSSLPQATVFNPAPSVDTPEAAGGAFVQMSRLSAPLVNELVVSYDLKDFFNRSEPANDASTQPVADLVTNPVLPVIIDILFGAAVNGTVDPGDTQPDFNLAPANLPRTDLVAAFLTGFEGVNMNGSVAEMLRLNTSIPPKAREDQSNFGVAGGDLAGFPNGRRPGDDVVDIALRVVMGALCYPISLEGGAPVNLGFCTPADAPIGNQPLTDGAPLSAADLDNTFPYLLTPYPGSPSNAPLPMPN